MTVDIVENGADASQLALGLISALPLEDERAQLAYGQGSLIGKELICYREYLPDRVHVILVKEKLGV